MEANFASTFSGCFHRRANADGQGDAGGGWKCGSKVMEKSKVGTPMHGFTDNYIRVEMDHDDQLDNQLIRVRMGGFNEEGTALKGVLV